MLTSADRSFYARQISLPEFGTEGQQRLQEASVLVIGAGGLGCPVLTYLAGAGVGTLGVIDFDRVEISNLHRQVLFSVADVGRPKAEVAAERLGTLNPNIRLKAYTEALTPDNVLRLFADYDLIVDGSDNFPTRYLVNDACLLLNKPLVFGSIFKFEGQVSVFNYQNGPTYRCLYPVPPAEHEVPNCAEIGVLGVLPGVVGTLQAVEAIKVLTGIGEVLSGKILVYDALRASFQTFRFAANPTTRQERGLRADYGLQCAAPLATEIEEVTYDELLELLESENPPFFIDVREPHEYDRFNLGGENWPLKTLPQHLPELLSHPDIVLCCQSGVRSRQAAELLAKEFPEHSLRHLRGGVGAWA
ncbi:molybdopterin-synthase adenylyltransferase MoeB [Rhabdobacter roseus]|uniref:Molybdopterin-synthase adenylyltransferase n=1 Tax=Rhabdobacter roseus TaxID=1655419 RepID=A0A840TPV6_9BACT|nr:HesA/MoeB/ThiF family protein [Rhabdobacter roseus]MBB5285374.1 adenylyltransferase/sulfurtransferase [Rhabdobacter roseus]